MGYVYDAVYYNPQEEIDNGFGTLSGVPIAGSQARQEITMWEDYRTPVGVWEARAHGLGGWTLDVQHFYDPGGKVLYLGDGSRRSAENISLVTETIAGTGEWGYGGDGGQAMEAVQYCPMGIALGPERKYLYILVTILMFLKHGLDLTGFIGIQMPKIGQIVTRNAEVGLKREGSALSVDIIV